MDLEKVFRVVRKEQAVLWVGSGFSNYAGYLMGKALSKRFYDELTAIQKIDVDENITLPDMAEEFIRCNFGNRNELNSILKEEYEKEPLSIKYHKVLAQIPHFKTIITTNYDPLFKRAYGNLAQVIFNDTHIANIGKGVEVIHAHGDLSDLNSIIIAKSDYEKYFFNNMNNPLFWNLITERLSTKAIIFLGYSLEDSNINVILNKFNTTLGQNKREMFLIAPGFPAHKQNSLIQRGVQYINLYGEDFVEELYRDIRRNIKKDFEKKWISAETLTKFVDNLDLQAQLQFKGTEQLAALHPKRGKQAEGLLKFTLKKESTGIDLGLQKFLSGEMTEDFEINSKDVSDLELSISDINILDSSVENVSLLLKREPSLEGEIKVVFRNGKEFEKIKYKAFGIKGAIKIELMLKQSSLIIIYTVSDKYLDINFEFYPAKIHDSVNAALFAYDFFESLNSNLGIQIFYYENGLINRFASLSSTKATKSKNKRAFRATVDYLHNLKALQTYYGLHFHNIEQGSENFEQVSLLKTLTEKGVVDLPYKQDLKFETDPSFDYDEFKKYLNEGYLPVLEGEFESIKLHNEIIELGFPVIYFKSPGIKFDSDSRILEISSKTKKVQLNYVKKPTVPKKINLLKQIKPGPITEAE